MKPKEEKTFFLIAGEASGDILGASLIRGLQTHLPYPLKITGIGGEEMEHAGQFKSLFPLRELSHMGLWDIMSHAPHLLKRLRETTDHILKLQPRALITLDAPEFCLRVAKKVAATRPEIACIHCVAPSVWAWRPKRAKKIAGFLDHLLALFPFEPPYFEKEGLPCTFVGHPLLEHPKGSKASFYEFFPQFAPNLPLLCLLPGSRRGEIERHLPVFAKAVAKIRQTFPQLQVILPTVASVESLVQEGLSLFEPPAPLLLQESHRRFDAFAAADVALAASGTVALELAFQETPFVIGYRVSPFAAMILQQILQVSQVCLVNLLLKRSAVPECLQEDCNSEKLASEVLQLLLHTSAREKQKHDLRQAIQALRADLPFSQKTAQAIREACAL